MSDKQSLHLSNVAACLSSGGSFSHLPSHLLWICCKIGGAPIGKSSRMCPKCCQVWYTGKFSMKLKSMTSPGPRMRKILRKIEKTPDKLNRVESSLLKRYQQNNKSKLILQCDTCRQETAIEFQKKPVDVSHVTENEVIGITQSTKKKRKKDRFAGLNASAVLSATPSPLSIPLKMSTLKTPVSKSVGSSASTSATTSHTFPQTASLRKSVNNSVTSTPKSSRPQPQDSHQKKPKSIKQKMNLLREEIKQAEQNRVKEEYKALSMRNINIRKNNKLQDFLNKREKDVHLEDRINSLLQL